jgi:hypothetical protein
LTFGQARHLIITLPSLSDLTFQEDPTCLEAYHLHFMTTSDCSGETSFCLSWESLLCYSPFRGLYRIPLDLCP